MVKQWEREQVWSKLGKKNIKTEKPSPDSEPEVEIINPDPSAVPAAPAQPTANVHRTVNIQSTSNIQSNVQPATFTQPTANAQPGTTYAQPDTIRTNVQPALVQNVPPPPPLMQAPIQLQAQPHQIATFPQFPGFIPNLPLHLPFNDGYVAPTFSQNPGLYNPFRPNLPNPPTYPQSPQWFYPTVGPHQPSGNDWFPVPAQPHPTLPRSCSPQPQTNRTSFPEPHPGWNFTSHQSQPPTQPLFPGPSYHHFNQYQDRRYVDDPSQFPPLQEWFAGIDNHPQRGAHGDEYSQYSYTFELQGLKTLLDLEGLKPSNFFEHFGISESSARRLLKFAKEDIQSIRTNTNTFFD